MQLVQSDLKKCYYEESIIYVHILFLAIYFKESLLKIFYITPRPHFVVQISIYTCTRFQ